MRTWMLLLFVSGIAAACPKGSIEYEGICAADPAPVETAKGNDLSWVSDEKPPHNQQPAWQTGEVKALTPPTPPPTPPPPAAQERICG